MSNSQIAARLRAAKETIARQATEAFFASHPDWRFRYGEAGALRGREDAGSHVEFLAAAIEADSLPAYREYAVWTRQVLEARGISSMFLAENFGQVRDAAALVLDEQGRRVVAEFTATAMGVCDGAAAPAAASGLDERAERYLGHILAGERAAALRVAMEAVHAGVPTMSIYSEILQPAMYEVGRRWQENQITVAREHMATAITQVVMTQIYASSEPTPFRGGRVVITGVQGERHQLGAQMVADALEFDGRDVRFLGTDLPHAGILEAVAHHKCDIVGISATMLFSLPQVIALIADLRKRMPATAILVGGAAFRTTPHLWKEVGATACASDLAGAVAQAAMLLAGRK